MNAPFALAGASVRAADLRQPDEVARIEAFCGQMGSSIFHRTAWLEAVEAGTGNRALGLLAERNGDIVGWLPLTEVRSPIFGAMLASSGFAVAGGPLADNDKTASQLCDAAAELAHRLACTTVELRGGIAGGEGWDLFSDRHSGFAQELAADDDEQLLQIPRKQRAEVRKGLRRNLSIHIGTDESDRAAHYAVYSESVRNLGTPVFPRTLFDAVLDRLDADILTVRYKGLAVASVLSLYHDGAVMPYWGGGTWHARNLRANDRMYFELMNHARRRGCTRFDFGRSKTGSGPYLYKKTWGFEPQPLTYARWTAPGFAARDADPTSDAHAARIALWKQLPLPLANTIGPFISRGLG